MKGSMQIQCNNCGQMCGPESLKFVDDKQICLKCLYGNVKPLTIMPIGYVVNDKERNSKGFGTTGSDISTIKLFSGMARFMKGLAQESHLSCLTKWLASRSLLLQALFFLHYFQFGEQIKED